MNIIVARPPNFEKIAAAFPAAHRAGTLFCYGDTIYHPSGTPLPRSLVAHECIHADQQKAAGGPEIWWDRYIADPEFRFQQELEAHRAEYGVSCVGLARNQRRHVLSTIAQRLASALYGHVVTVETAKRLIKASEMREAA